MDSQKDFVVSQHIGFQKVNRTLQATSDPAMLDLENSTSCLQIVKAHLETVEGEVNSIAKQVQKDISSTEIKLNDSNEKLKTVEASYDNCLENIALLEKRKQECDADSKLELARAHNNWKAIKPSITKAAKDIRLIYALGYIASAALSPFTLGGSMAVTACTHAVAVARISSDIGDTMSIATKIAESYKLTARQLVDDIQELSVKCKIEEAEMKRLKSETVTLRKQIGELDAVRNAAYAIIKANFVASQKLQEAGVKLYDAIQETESFELVQRLLDKKQSWALANEHLRKLKEKWEEVNNMLRQLLIY